MVVLVFDESVFEFVVHVRRPARYFFFFNFSAWVLGCAAWVLVFHAWPVPPGIDSSPKVFIARILLSVRIDFRASGLLILCQLRFSFANFLNSDRAERFRIFCLQYVSTSMPGCRCCHFRLNTPAQRTRGQCQARHEQLYDGRCCSCAGQAPVCV